MGVVGIVQRAVGWRVGAGVPRKKSLNTNDARMKAIGWEAAEWAVGRPPWITMSGWGTAVVTNERLGEPCK